MKLQKRYIAGRHGWRKMPSVMVRTPEGKGLYVPGTARRRGCGLYVAGTGLYVPGTAGDGIFKDIGKAFKKGTQAVGRTFSRGARDVGRFLTAPATKAVIRQIRKTASPFVRQMIPQLLGQAAEASALIPGVGTAVAPVAKSLTPLATKGALKLLDLGEAAAEKRGYGSAIDAVKYKKSQLGKQNQRRAMDMRELNVYSRVAQSAPIRGKSGRGLMPL